MRNCIYSIVVIISLIVVWEYTANGLLDVIFIQEIKLGQHTSHAHVEATNLVR